jgi:hypothetical protein
LQKNDYNLGARLLHRLALGFPLLGKMSLEMDSLTSTPRPRTDIDTRHVFISGLARAGTTVLMREFYASGQFRSLTYRDMPFVLMPGLWKRLFGRFHTHGAARERAHGDGIEVDFDSPEAFEEVFWRTFSGDEYIFEGGLRPYTADQETISLFRSYIANVIASADHPSQVRYLSKNNNNILRLAAIRSAFPDAVIIIPFRSPGQQALSLLQQHQKFSAGNEADAFTVNYMKWLGHYEFGAGHRPFRFADAPARPGAHYPATDVNYWLGTWIDSYEELLRTAPAGAVFVSFERLCAEPEIIMPKLFALAAVGTNEGGIERAIRPQKAHVIDGLDPELLARAEDVYARLFERALA